jgi:hypothetical protein
MTGVTNTLLSSGMSPFNNVVCSDITGTGDMTLKGFGFSMTEIQKLIDRILGIDQLEEL